MAFDGNGVFLRLYNWTNDAAANIKIRADRMDNETNGIATGLSTCITKDGQTTITANLPMAGYIHTNVGAGTLRTQYTRLDQTQDGKVNWADGGGTADAITATYSPVITTLVDGQECYVRATAANATTTPTFSPNALTARTIVKNGNVALAAGDIAGDGHELHLRYRLSDTKWELLNPAVTGVAVLSANNAFTGNNTFAGTSTFNAAATFNGATTVAGSLAISGTSSEAAYITLAEDTDNGTNKVKLQAPSSLASDITVNLPIVAGTIPVKTELTIVGTGYAETTAAASISSSIPYDDTIPQIGEGTQILSLAHTAISGTNKLDFSITVQGVNSAGASVIIALFKDSDANALAAGFWVPANEAYSQTFNFRVTAGDASAHTYTVRLGTTSGTFTLNGTGGARRLGGVCVTSMTIREVTA